MTIRTLDTNASLDTQWEELVYTEARLLKDDRTKDLAPTVDSLIKRVEEARAAQRAAWRAEIIAQAGVDAVDDTLDDLVETTGRDLLHALHGDRKHARYQRYFARPPHAVIRLGLSSEVEVVRQWPGSLAGEPEPQIKALAGSFETTIKAADEALEERAKAGASTSDHRVRSIVTLVDDINRARRSIYGTLVQRASAAGLANDWADRFFQRGGRAPRAADQGTEAQKPA